jgi:hypothetical protein
VQALFSDDQSPLSRYFPTDGFIVRRGPRGPGQLETEVSRLQTSRMLSKARIALSKLTAPQTQWIGWLV